MFKKGVQRIVEKAIADYEQRTTDYFRRVEKASNEHARHHEIALKSAEIHNRTLEKYCEGFNALLLKLIGEKEKFPTPEKGTLRYAARSLQHSAEPCNQATAIWLLKLIGDEGNTHEQSFRP